MRVEMEKVLFFGAQTGREAFFARLQQEGVAEFISIMGMQASTVATPALPVELRSLLDALHLLRGRTPIRQVEGTDYRSAPALASAILEHNEQCERYKEERRILQKELERIEPLGEFSLSLLRQIEQDSGWVAQFFYHKSNRHAEIPENWIPISSHAGMQYFFSFSPTRLSYPREIIIEKSPHEIREELAELDRKLGQIEDQLSSFATQEEMLRAGLIDAYNSFHLDTAIATASTCLDHHLFAIEAWIPSNDLSHIEALAMDMGVSMEPLDVQSGETPPTHLKNEGLSRLGEELVGIYDTPSIEDQDPSLWVFSSFLFFFSMIVADAGYGLLILLMMGGVTWKWGKRPNFPKRIVQLATALSIGCIIWGVAIGSYLGIAFSPTNPIKQYSLVNWVVHKKAEYILHTRNATYQSLVSRYPEVREVSQPEALLLVGHQDTKENGYPIYQQFVDHFFMEFVLLVGVVHISSALLRYVQRNWSAVGWSICLWGGYLFFPKILGATSLAQYLFHAPPDVSQVGLYLMEFGLVVAVGLGVFQHRLKGLAELMHSIQLFADIMSYLRIYALSLAGMVMAETFNQIGSEVPLYVGIFVILAGHTINFALAMMGGLIHGLRLNFIEWYHYSFIGGGRKFKPLVLFKLE